MRDMPPPPAAGLWALAGDRLIIVEPQGPATIVVPTERVRMLAVDLPLPSRGRRLAALPFAIEDRIADATDMVHVALGARPDPVDAPNRYLVGVVRREAMDAWLALAAEQGLGDVPVVPDALLLPRPAEGWSVEICDGRALVLAADGTGFAMPVAMLRAAWEAAGRPPIQGYGAPLPDDMQRVSGVLDPRARAAQAAIAVAALDLRQGDYAVRRAGLPNGWRRFGWIVGIGVAAHVLIAGADLLMLRVIADRRAVEARTVATLAAPGVPFSGDIRTTLADMLPKGGGKAPDRFLTLLNRVAAALAPVAGVISVQAMTFEGRVLTLDLAPGEPGLAARVDAALRAAHVPGRAMASPDGAIRITVSAV